MPFAWTSAKERFFIPLSTTTGASAGAAPTFSGVKRISVNGWRRGAEALWRIEQEVPLPFTLLAVQLDLSVSA